MSEDRRIYVVVPRTVDSDKPPYKLSMSCGRMSGQVAHAAGVLQSSFPVMVENENEVTLQVSNSTELEILRTALCREGIGFVEYRDEDKAFEGKLLTAIATVPIEKHRSEVLKRLRPWKCKCNETDLRGVVGEAFGFEYADEVHPTSLVGPSDTHWEIVLRENLAVQTILDPNIPRRIRVDLASPVELAIRKAREVVEGMEADVRLTEATVLLGQALDKVADFVDEKVSPRSSVVEHLTSSQEVAAANNSGDVGSIPAGGSSHRCVK